MRYEQRVVKTELEREVAALTKEGEQYAAAGMMDRVELVNEQLKARGADIIPIPKAAQTRNSTQAATRTKRAAK